MALEIIIVILLSMLPISELRGAIPYGLYSDLNLVLVFLTAVAANILIIPIIFFFLNYFHRHLTYFSIYRHLFGKFVERVRAKSHGHISKYGYLGLTILVAIPLPVTGAYTGTLAAWLFNMQKKKSMIALSLGVIIAGIIVTTAYVTGVGVFSIFINSRLLN